MRKSTLWRAALACLLVVAGLVPWQTARAELLFSENFEYDSGTELYNQGGWMQYASNTADPIKVYSPGLTYASYLDKATGCAVKLGNTASGQDLFVKFSEAGVSSGSIYASFLLNISDIGTKDNKGYFFSLIPETKNGLGDKKSGTEYVKLFAYPDASDASKFNLGIARNGGTTVATKQRGGAMDLNTTYLVVVAYNFDTAGVSMWINPAIQNVEPTPAVNSTNSSDGGTPSTTFGGFKYVELRQGQTASADVPVLQLDGLRIANAWADLFTTSGGGDENQPALSLSESSHSFGYQLEGASLTWTNTVKGQNLTADVTVECPEGITATPATLSKDDVMSEAGATVTFAYSPAVGDFEQTISFKSGDLQKDYTVSGSVLPVIKSTTAADLMAKAKAGDEEGNNYQHTGSMIVTAVEDYTDQWNKTYKIFYAQDATGAVRLAADYLQSEQLPVVGDQIKDFLYMIPDASNVGQVSVVSLGSDWFTKVEPATMTIEPEVVQPNVVAANGQDYINELVKVNNLTCATEGATFSTDWLTLTDGTNQVRVKCLAGSDLIGQALPSKINVTGLVYALNACNLILRSKADVEEVQAPAAEFIVDPESKMFVNMEVNKTYTFTADVLAANLSSDITVSCPADITCEPATLTKAAAEEGATLTFTVKPVKAQEQYDEYIRFFQGEEQLGTINVTGNVISFITLANTTQVAQATEVEEYSFMPMRFTGKAVVTGINTEKDAWDNTYTAIYMQDMFGGLKLCTSYLDNYQNEIKVGDELTNIEFMMEYGDKSRLMTVYPYTGIWYEKVAEGKSKTPLEITMSEITQTTAPEYLYRLVTVSGANLTATEGTWGTGWHDFTDGDHTAQVCAFSPSDLTEAALPGGQATFTGIMMSPSVLRLGVRNSQDIQVGAAMLEISAENLVDFNTTAAPINKPTEVVKLTVAAENLPEALPIQFQSNEYYYYKAEPANIPAGSGTYEIKVIYTPDEVGRHSTMLMVNTDSFNPEYNYSRKINSKCYDPENLPSITVEPATVQLETTPGTPVTATVKVTGNNCFDYINAVKTLDTPGLLISTGMLLPDSQEAEVTVTFNPTEEGEYNQVWNFTTTLCSAPATLTVTGVCEGVRPPEEKQGDEFSLSEENPLVTYTQNFEDVVKNEVLSIDGWTNVAMTGTRAWWGYEQTDGEPFKAAKVTAYDSTIRPANEEDAELMLISPALNYKDALDRHLQFSVMGQFLSEGMVNKFDILLGYPNGTDKPDFYEMSGFDFPADSETAGEWIPYDVDMSVVEDMPDTFWIAFRLKGKRSQAEPATYYVDNFVWNPSGSAVNGVNVSGGTYDVYNMQGIKVLSGADKSKVDQLPAGLYIVNGKKVVLK